MEIQELPEYLSKPDEAKLSEEPLLKYVVQMAEKLCPNVGFFQSDKVE